MGSCILKEWKGLFTIHRRAALVLILLPLIYTCLFGGLFCRNVVTRVPTGVVNLDRGPQGETMVRTLGYAEELEMEEFSGERELEEALSSGLVQGAVIIPPDFSRSIGNGETAQAEAVVNLGNTVSGSAVLKGTQGAIETYNMEMTAERRMAAGWTADAAAKGIITMSMRSLYNGPGGYEDFFLAVLMIHAMQIAAVFTLAPMAALEVLRRRREAAARPVQETAAKVLVYTVLNTAVLLGCLALAAGAFRLVFRGSLAETTLLIAVFSAAMVSFSLAAGFWTRHPVKVITYTVFYIMPSVLFSGAIWPRYSMDWGSLLVSFFIPIGYAADDLRDLLVRGASPSLWADLSMLAVFAFLAFWLAVKGLKRAEGQQQK